MLNFWSKSRCCTRLASTPTARALPRGRYSSSPPAPPNIDSSNPPYTEPVRLSDRRAVRATYSLGKVSSDCVSYSRR